MQHNHTSRSRKLLAMAVLAALSGAALAQGTEAGSERKIETRFYGFVNGEVESVQAVGGATPFERRGRVSDGNSRLGFAGSVSLRGDFKGIWQLEGSLNNFDEGGTNDRGQSNTLTSRNSYVGLDSARFGRLMIGNNDSVYRSLVGSGGGFGGNLGLTTKGLDLWNNTSAQMTGNVDSVFGRGEARYKSSVHYLSPEWRGLQAGASYGYDEERDNSDDRARYSVAVKYTLGRLTLGAGYDRQDNTGLDITRLEQGMGMRSTGVSGANTAFYKVLAVYHLPTKTTLGLGYEQGRYGYSQQVMPSAGYPYTYLSTGRVKQHSVMGSLSQEVGYDTTVMLSLGKLGKLDGTTFAKPGDFGATQFSLGATYRIDDMFMPYVYITRIKNKSQQNVNLGQSPLYSNNKGSDQAYLAPGDSPRAIGFGFIARF